MGLLPYSPIPVLGLSSFCSFGYASLVGLAAPLPARAFSYSPILVLGLSSFRSFGYASLVGLCPTPQQGAALHPRGGPVPLDSRARIRSLIALRFFFFFLFLSTSHSPLNSHFLLQ